jgi:hypothetical protein
MYDLYYSFVFVVLLFIYLIELKIFFKSFYNNNLNFVYKENFLNIYIITHKDFNNKISNSYYKILCDDCSQLKNKYKLQLISSHIDNELYIKKIGYCEGSKMYYIWKNYKNNKINTKYIGFNHYRRIFSFLNKIPNLNNIFKKYDVILKKTFYLKNENIKEQYSKYHIGKNMDEIIDIIKVNFTNYYITALKTMNMLNVSFCNIFIMKRNDFIEYGEFVFGVLFEFDRRNNLKNDNDIKNYIKNNFINKTKVDTIINTIDYQRRVEAFLLERLSNIYYNFKFKKKFEINTM